MFFRRNIRVGFRRPPLPVRLFHMFVLAAVTAFWAAAVTCALSALHRIANAQELSARAEALATAGPDLTDADRRTLVESVRARIG